jgi:methylated-DNA-[protein]-cysteine S-methyltransferase
MPSPSVYNAIIALPVNFHDTKVGIHTRAGQLAAIDFLPSNTALKAADNFLAQQVVDQLGDYFNNGKFQFNVPFLLQGTAFQQRVWQALMAIQAGETCSYGRIADQLHSSARAVGNACRANPIPIVIPCHRVVAKQGIGGYCGQTGGQRLYIKQLLLEHERG